MQEKSDYVGGVVKPEFDVTGNRPPLVTGPGSFSCLNPEKSGVRELSHRAFGRSGSSPLERH